jgi:site-specific recombinase XerD
MPIVPGARSQRVAQYPGPVLIPQAVGVEQLNARAAAARFAKYARLAGLPKHKRHTHCLRHSRAMHTIKTAGIENVRQLCGHASIASTGYYLKVSDSSAWAALGTGSGL